MAIARNESSATLERGPYGFGYRLSRRTESPEGTDSPLTGAARIESTGSEEQAENREQSFPHTWCSAVLAVSNLPTSRLETIKIEETG